MIIIYIFNECEIKYLSLIFISEHTTFVCGYHVFYIYVSILSSILFQYLQSLLHQVSEVLFLLLSVINFVPDVHFYE